ncbi:14349_t:CDS:2 [Funneliformis geosporum]|nr:14349_t:CDS:2 [Funneliformis geosporum]
MRFYLRVKVVIQEDGSQNFITHIPPGQSDDRDYYCYHCPFFDSLKQYGVDIRNGIATYHTVDYTTTYWVDFGVEPGDTGDYTATNRGGYNSDACFSLKGWLGSSISIDELSLEDSEHDSYLVDNWDTETLIDFLKEQNLKLDDDDLGILRNEKIDGPSFLDMTEEKFKQAGLKMGPAMKLAKEAKSLKEKPKRAFSSYRSLEEVLEKYGIKIPHPIDEKSPEFKLCIDDILRKQNQPGKGVAQNLMQCRSSCEVSNTMSSLHSTILLSEYTNKSSSVNIDELRYAQEKAYAFEEYEYVYGIVTTGEKMTLAENVKLKHALEEHEARFTNLEQKDKEKTTLIAKLDDDIREIKQEQNAVNISAQSNTPIPKSPIHPITSQSSISPSIEGISKQSDYSDHSIEKNNADPGSRERPPPISQDFDSIPLDQTNKPSVKFSIVTEAEKKKWDREQFLTALENDKKLYRKVIERKRDDPLMIDPRKYYPFLTDRDRLIGEELMRRSMIERRFKTGWLDDNIKKWEDTHTQFIEIFALT